MSIGSGTVFFKGKRKKQFRFLEQLQDKFKEAQICKQICASLNNLQHEIITLPSYYLIAILAFLASSAAFLAVSNAISQPASNISSAFAFIAALSSAPLPAFASSNPNW